MPSTITTEGGFDVRGMIGLSGPVNTDIPYDTTSLGGKTILITGGASGFGEAFAKHWTSHGSNIIIGDVNDSAGEKLVAELRSLTGSSGHQYYQHCDVTSWTDQLALFQTAVRLSPTGGIDAVVANAGILEKDAAATGQGVENPKNLDLDENPEPQPPSLAVLNTNLTGVVYTVHLAMYWLPKNKDPKYAKVGAASAAAGNKRDRHILLIGSIAGILPIPGQLQYTAAKHAVTGIFRSLRGSTFRHGIRSNLVMPYFVHTPFIPWQGLTLLAGGGMAELEDVVDAATRLMADESIVGRGLAVGAKVDVVDDGNGQLRIVEGKKKVEGERTQAVWDVYAHDYEEVELFVFRYVRLMYTLVKISGWIGWLTDVFHAYVYRKKVAHKRRA
jgi:NAD(P)-dependent dehydrogenase (short-subunit alcohol dehydrogenase family)